MAGARSQSNLFLLDGVSNMDTQIGSALGNFRITDAVQEFAVQSSVPTAEFGRGHGAQVSIVTKSGTNGFHGSVFEYLRNSNLDAADFFTNKLGGTKNTLHRNQYGATFGGPVRKDRTFFFGSWEGFRQVNPTVSATRVPTDAERATVTDPISKALLKFWPSPNGVGRTYWIPGFRRSTFPADSRFSAPPTTIRKDVPRTHTNCSTICPGSPLSALPSIPSDSGSIRDARKPAGSWTAPRAARSISRPSAILPAAW